MKLVRQQRILSLIHLPSIWEVALDDVIQKKNTK